MVDFNFASFCILILDIDRLDTPSPILYLSIFMSLDLVKSFELSFFYP